MTRSKIKTRPLSRRRLLVGGSAMFFAWLRRGTVHAQAAGGVPRVGVLWSGGPTSPEAHRGIAAFRRGLRELGYVEGRSISLEYRGTDGKERLEVLARELVQTKVAIILAGATRAALAAQRASPNIPIVFCAVSADPVKSGLVASLARPGGNVTGTVLLGTELDAKRLDLLVQALTGRPRVALLRIPDDAQHDQGAREVEDAARRLRIEILSVEARGPQDIDHAMQEARRRGAVAILALGAPEYAAMRGEIARAGLRHRLPTMTPEVGFAEAGGLLEYGPDILDSWHRAATYVDKILKGVKPADLPVEQPLEMPLTVNLKTARALGLTLSPAILVRANKVIE